MFLFLQMLALAVFPFVFGGFHLDPPVLDLLFELLVPGMIGNFRSLEDVCNAANQTFSKRCLAEVTEVSSSFL